MINLTLHVWRQDGPDAKGGFETYRMTEVDPEISFLEMMDLLNEQLSKDGKVPVVFDSDCREGICGACSMVVNGRPHGPGEACTTCQVRVRQFNDGDELWIEPFRAGAFPLVRDLMVDRSALDRVIESGGYISVHSGPKPEPNSIPIPHAIAEEAMDAAECIGCGACVAACPNASAMLFTSAKIHHLNMLPQGKPEAKDRVMNMVHKMDEEGFGACTNYAECQDACPKDISIRFISAMNRDYQLAALIEPIKRKGTMESQ
ncbi:MAG: succinate dehydrogenase/fumarate reductase iron-sulfur subunit [Phycisphaerales bacterium]|nr:succinate dehydrogenase/fumarate reductase iron-sulfur subunit [Phycisphaerales bacterium]